jgi:hypothetical protein
MLFELPNLIFEVLAGIIAGLLLALIDFPDFGGSLGRIAGSVEKMADMKSSEDKAEAAHETSGIMQSKHAPPESTKTTIALVTKRS